MRQKEGNRQSRNVVIAGLMVFSLSSLILLGVGCGSKNTKVLSLQDEAAQLGITVDRLKEEKQAAARMNMNWEDHKKNIEKGEDMGKMMK